MTETFDHIIVGGGASGCVAAARLADEGNARVLLLEAGHSNKHPLLDMPPGIFKLINGSKYMRFHKTTPQAHLGGRMHDIPQGHVLGGGSSVNAQVYMRGCPSDYDDWQKELHGGNDTVDWSWKSVLPHFRAMEDNNRLCNELHGSGGPLLVSDPGHIDELSRLFVRAVQRLGEPFNPDFNGPRQRGVGFYQFMNRAGKRSSAAYAYLAPQRNNPNLTIRLQSEAREIILNETRAVGVVYKSKNGKLREAYCDGEIIVSAGALITPKLLMLSGIGPAAHLQQVDIPCRHDLPGVGQNLVDHPEVPATAQVNGPYGYFRQGEGWRMIRNGIQFRLFGTGPVTSAGVEAGAFVNPSEPDAHPSIQAFCVPIVYGGSDTRHLVKDDYGLTITTVLVRPKSRGEVRLASNNPEDMPLVSPNLLKDETDMEEMVKGQRFFVRAFSQSPLAEKIKQVMLPDPIDLGDEALREHCRRFVKTNYHPAGTARMGRDGDPTAVLDSRMRVRGVDGLRICDLSAVPNIPSGNTQAPAMMLGDRCADMVMGKL